MPPTHLLLLLLRRLRRRGLRLHGVEPAALLVLGAVDGGRVLEPQRAVEAEEHEAQQHLVEFQEGQHHLVVHVRRQLLAELVRHQPRHLLAHHLRLVVDALDADEALAQRLALDHVHVPLAHQPLARCRPLRADLILRRQQREQMHCGQRVVQIRQRGLGVIERGGAYGEGRVALLHQVVQRHFRLVLPLALRLRRLVTRVRTGDLNASSRRKAQTFFRNDFMWRK